MKASNKLVAGALGALGIAAVVGCASMGGVPPAAELDKLAQDMAKASFRSIHGLIASDWKVAGGLLNLTVTVPPNTTATIVVPTRDPASVKESGKPAGGAPGLKPAKNGNGEAAFEVGSGTYRFTAAAR